MTMAERIKNKRIDMGLTQEELAEMLGLQKSAVAKYENGRVENIKRSIIFKMSEVLNCSPAYLMGWEEEKPEKVLNVDHALLLKDYDELTDTNKIVARDLIRSLLATQKNAQLK